MDDGRDMREVKRDGWWKGYESRDDGRNIKVVKRDGWWKGYQISVQRQMMFTLHTYNVNIMILYWYYDYIMMTSTTRNEFLPHLSLL